MNHTFNESLIAYMQVKLEERGSGYASKQAIRIYDSLAKHPRGIFEALNVRDGEDL